MNGWNAVCGWMHGWMGPFVVAHSCGFDVERNLLKIKQDYIYKLVNGWLDGRKDCLVGAWIRGCMDALVFAQPLPHALPILSDIHMKMNKSNI